MRIRFFIGLVLLVLLTSKVNAQEDLKLWYNHVAKDWMNEALPLGNGYMGAMFFGGIEKEQIQFTEGTLWSGGPNAGTSYNYGNRDDSHKSLSTIRELIDEGDHKAAERLTEKYLTGVINTNDRAAVFGDYGGQQTMGDLFIEIDNDKNKVKNYRRLLDINNSEARIEYSIDGEQYSRTYFANYPDNVLVYHFHSSCITNYKINYKSPHQKDIESFDNGVYSYTGHVKDNNMAFQTCMRFDTDGELIFNEGVLTVNKANYLIVYHTASTDYQLKYPNYKGNDFVGANNKVMEEVLKKGYKTIREQHRADYNELFSRVELLIGGGVSSLPTNERLHRYASGASDLGLEQLYFQYSRYLMISGSRPGTMPLNLQGKWNNSTDPPWACDYHMNINQQMLYWPAEVTNLSECHLPLFDYMQSLVEPGKISAKSFFNSRGWIVNTMNNPFGYTAPGWGLPWGFFPAAAGWLCRHSWEHYEFTGDTTFLRQTAFPMMKEAALFWIDYLVQDDDGYLVSSPSFSPEHGGISKGASMDHQIVWDLFNNCVQACEVLGLEDDFYELAKQKMEIIQPTNIGSWGQLQEWKEDKDDPKNKHRHVSHLYALYPGNQISIETTPALATASKVSLNARGDSGTGWSLAWKVNFWARIKDGDRAYKLFRRLLRPTDSATVEMLHGGGSYENLLCAHPPFQLDGNMGGCAGMAELLLQSHTGTIELLPALPKAWNKGQVSGLKARGDFEVTIIWDNRSLTGAVINGQPGEKGKYSIAGGRKIDFVIPASGMLKVVK